MKIVADESVDKVIVLQLRQEGHSVIYIAEQNPGIADQQVLDLSNDEKGFLTPTLQPKVRADRRGEGPPGGSEIKYERPGEADSETRRVGARLQAADRHSKRQPGGNEIAGSGQAQQAASGWERDCRQRAVGRPTAQIRRENPHACAKSITVCR
jgi:hypothetical protein